MHKFPVVFNVYPSLVNTHPILYKVLLVLIKFYWNTRNSEYDTVNILSRWQRDSILSNGILYITSYIRLYPQQHLHHRVLTVLKISTLHMSIHGCAISTTMCDTKISQWRQQGWGRESSLVLDQGFSKTIHPHIHADITHAYYIMCNSLPTVNNTG